MHRLKGCISLRPRTRFLTTVPLFPMEKRIIYLPGSTVWAKYSSQGIYKANKIRSRLSAEERYLNSRLPRRLSNPGLLHRRVESKHSVNAGPPTMVRFHHKLGELHSGPHSVINIPGPLHKLCDNDAQPPREKDPEHTKQMPKDPIQPQRPVQHDGLSTHGQYNHHSSRQQQRGNTFPTTRQSTSRTVAVVSAKSNSGHRSAPTRQTQRVGRQRIKRVLRLQRMSNRPTSDSTLLKRVQCTCRPVCLTSNSPPANICQLETRPGCYLHRYNDPGLVPSKRLCLSTVQSNFSSAEENISGPSRPGLSGPSMASTALVANSSEPNQEPCHDPNLQTSAKGSCISSENPPNVPKASSSRLSHTREQHQTEGFSEDVTEILLSATRASTRKTYQSAWGQWSSWCSKRKVNPISATLNDVLVF